MPADAVNRGGVPTASPTYRVEATVPAGAMSQRRKQGLVADVTDLLLTAEDGDRDPMRVWVLITELPNGNWGAAGQVIDFDELRKAARAASGNATGAGSPGQE
jgi:phenylpyruvate tautomerase PptA (4-oxalocrotonate tautomerase family)